MEQLTTQIGEAARALGLDRVGFASATVDGLHRAALVAWLEGGLAAGMGFMAATRQARLDPQRLLPGARSAIMVAQHYPAPRPTSGPRISAYAAGPDYHIVIRERLAGLCESITALRPKARLLPFVDTHPVLERALAAAAGLGFVGKNAMLIHPREGSFFFLGGILTDLELSPGTPLAENCGICRACLEACPTGAFPAPFVLDSRRCIGYLTVEHRGEFTEEESRSVGTWVFGCDACQTVCPFNRKAMERGEPAEVEVDLAEELRALAEEAFTRRYGQRAQSRARRRGLIRNLLAVVENTRDLSALGELARLARDRDPAVARMAEATRRRLLERE